MYQNFYNFIQKPFDVTPDPRFLYMSRNHAETLAAIIYGIRERRGFITVIGEVGTGKTTLLNATLEKLDEQTASAFIFNTDVTFEELLHMTLIEFGLATPEESLPKFVALDRLNRFATSQFAAGKNTVIIIDEAQTLNLHTMENLRLLSNLETPRYKLVQIVLSGQPELDEKLQRQEMRQLAQRINLKRYITPLEKTDTYRYIHHHLKVAGCPDPDFFDKPSLELIRLYSGGIPRKINMLCDNALLIGYGLGKKKITRSEIQEAIRDLSWSPFSHKAEMPPEVSQIKDKRTLRFMMLRVAAASAVLVLALILGAMSAAFRGSEVEIPELIPAFSRHLWATITGPHSSATFSDPGDIPSDARQDLKIIHSKPESPMLHAATEPPMPDAIIMDQTSKTPSAAEAAVKPEADPPIETRQTMQTVVNQQPVEKSSLILKQETVNTAVDEAFNLIVVRKGDSLSGIIEDNQGNFQEMLPLVLQANTQIRNPDLIMPGWVVRLPRHISHEK